MTRPLLDDYTCYCGNDTFRVKDARIRYLSDTRIEPVLACAKCSKTYDPGFTGTGNLKKRTTKK